MQKKRNMRGDPGSLDDEPSCSQNPEHPHGFDRNASHSAGRYVCLCEGFLDASVDDGSLAVVRQLAQRDDYVMVHATELQELLAQLDELRDRVVALTHREEKQKW